LEEEEYIENQIGEVIPGRWNLQKGNILFGGLAQAITTRESNIKIPEKWIETFPAGHEVIDHLTKLFKLKKQTPDGLILERRNLEYKLFRQIEELHILSKIQSGFSSVDDFMLLANSVSNRRKSRSGNSLEIHLEILFKQFGLHTFSKQCTTEGKKRPDFIFPSCKNYHDLDFPAENLRMLAVKTTCKDRWRQILNEADRVKQIHLFTLQEGVSPHQLKEMTINNVMLVVPQPLHKKYPKELRNQLTSLDKFILQTKKYEDG
jgi:type II restriction enzyme